MASDVALILTGGKAYLVDPDGPRASVGTRRVQITISLDSVPLRAKAGCLKDVPNRAAFKKQIVARTRSAPPFRQQRVQYIATNHLKQEL